VQQGSRSLEPTGKKNLNPFAVIEAGWQQWRGQPKILRGQNVDFRRATLSCLKHRLSKHEMNKYAKNLGGTIDPLVPPWLRLYLTVTLHCFEF